MSTFLTHITELSARQISTHFQLGTTGGYVTNTWLNPALSEWDRSSTSGFFQISPAAHIQYLGTKQTAAVTGMAHFHHLTDGRPNWTGGTAVFNYRRMLSRPVSFTVTTGANRFKSDYRRDLLWLQGGLDWLASPFLKLSLKAGPNWRTYSNITGTEGAEPEDMSSRYDSYGLEAQYWISHQWQLGGRFYSSLDHINDPGSGFVSSLSISHLRRNGLHISMHAGLEQFSQQFQADGPGGGIPPVVRPQTITLDDRFVRSGISAVYPVMKQVSLNAGFSNLLWMSSADNSVLADYEISAGASFSFSPVKRSAGKITSLLWKTSTDSSVALELQYKGDEPLYITGDFNDWEQPGKPLRKTGRRIHIAELTLNPGFYQYKILVRKDGDFEWIDLAGVTGTVDDGFGGRNGKIIIDNQQ